MSRTGQCVRSAAAGLWRQRDQDDLGAVTAHAQHPVAAFLAEVSDVRGGGLEDPRKPSSPGMATSAKSHGSGDWQAAVSRAPNCRRVNPSVRDSAGSEGQRTLPADGAR
jgi:hypothetical protein